MKKTKILWAALLAGLTLVSVGVPIQAAPVEVMDSILAIVNDEVITRNELRERVTLALMQLERHESTPTGRSRTTTSGPNDKRSRSSAACKRNWGARGGGRFGSFD